MVPSADGFDWRLFPPYFPLGADMELERSGPTSGNGHRKEVNKKKKKKKKRKSHNFRTHMVDTRFHTPHMGGPI